MPPRRRKSWWKKNCLSGFWRTPAKSLRVQVLVKGAYMTLSLTPFRFSKIHPMARQRQLSPTATVWAATIRDRMLGGHGVANCEAEAMTLGSVKDIPRIEKIYFLGFPFLVLLCR